MKTINSFIIFLFFTLPSLAEIQIVKKTGIIKVKVGKKEIPLKKGTIIDIEDHDGKSWKRNVRVLSMKDLFGKKAVIGNKTYKRNKDLGLRPVVLSFKGEQAARDMRGEKVILSPEDKVIPLDEFAPNERIVMRLRSNNQVDTLIINDDTLSEGIRDGKTNTEKEGSNAYQRLYNRSNLTVKDVISQIQTTPPPPKKITSPETKKVYSLKNNSRPLTIINKFKKKEVDLKPGDNFIVVDGDDRHFILIPPYMDLYDIKDRKDFLNRFKQGDVEKGKKLSKKDLSTPKVEKLYKFKAGSKSHSITLMSTNEKLELHPGTNFFITSKGDDKYIQIPPYSGVFKVDNPKEFITQFRQGNALEGNPFDDNKFPTERPPEPKKKVAKKNKNQATGNSTAPTLKGVVQRAISSQAKASRIVDPSKNGLKSFCNYLTDKDSQCSPKNNYAQRKLKEILSLEDILSDADEKYCIQAGLSQTSSKKRVAVCKNGKNQTAKVSRKNRKKYHACQSEEYSSFIYKELSQMSSCFNNIQLREMIPLVNHESRFNHNAYNLNTGGHYKGKLNASGLLQTTQVLIESQKEDYIINNRHFTGDSSYCKEIKQEMKQSPLSDERDVCERTSISKGTRKNLFLAMAQYARNKGKADSVTSKIRNDYFDDKIELFAQEDKEKIIIDITRLMHNRGDSKIKRRLEAFFYDLFNGGKRKIGSKEQRHGNSKIHKLVKDQNFKLPLKHEDFVKYFSSYIFYEGRTKHGSGGKNYEPNNKYREVEGGSYLHKIACEQELLNRKASSLASNRKISCGFPEISPDRMEKTQVEVGWYFNICKKENAGRSSRRVCSAKDPYKAKKKGERRLTDDRIEEYKNNERYLKLCDNESLRGLASRPLVEYYSKNPGKYK